MPKASHYKGFTTYFVEIIPSSPKGYEKPFTPSDKDRGIRCEANPQIVQIDGNRFYKLVTGVDNALEQIFEAIPKVIKDCRPTIFMSGAEGADKFFRCRSKDPNRIGQQLLLPLGDLVGVQLKLLAQLGDCFIFPQRSQRHLGFELRIKHTAATPPG